MKAILRCFAIILLQPLLSPSIQAGAKEDRQEVAQHFSLADAAPWTWVFYGDSITQGVEHTAGQRSFTEHFAERVRYHLARGEDCIINSGNNGYSSDQLINAGRYDWQVKRFQPNAVILMIGMNDMVNGSSPENFKENLTSLVKNIRTDGGIPILQTYNTIKKIEDPTAALSSPKYLERYEKLPTYMGIVEAVAREQDVILIDHFTYWKQNAAQPQVLADWLGDPVHPSGLGHTKMAALLFEELGLSNSQQ